MAKKKVSRQTFDKEMKRLHVELCALQDWVVKKGQRVVVVFEGRDDAGKGGTIKRITERVRQRVFRVVALPPPTERQKSQMYMQRYIPHMPAAGEIVLLDRSWYNGAGVERAARLNCISHSLDMTPYEKQPLDLGPVPERRPRGPNAPDEVTFKPTVRKLF
jgi:polyphosphate kinase 2 (PPK2 family)